LKGNVDDVEGSKSESREIGGEENGGVAEVEHNLQWVDEESAKNEQELLRSNASD
jgi:hypothetical protein